MHAPLEGLAVFGERELVIGTRGVVVVCILVQRCCDVWQSVRVRHVASYNNRHLDELKLNDISQKSLQ